MVQGQENGFSGRTNLGAYHMLHSVLRLWVSKYSLWSSVYLSVKEIMRLNKVDKADTQSLASSRYLTNISFLYFPFLLTCGSVSPTRPWSPLGGHLDLLIKSNAVSQVSPSTVPNIGVQYKCIGCWMKGMPCQTLKNLAQLTGQPSLTMLVDLCFCFLHYFIRAFDLWVMKVMGQLNEVNTVFELKIGKYRLLVKVTIPESCGL